MGRHEPSEARRGWGPFTGRQLTVIACVAIVAFVLVPTAALAASGAFTSTSAAAPAVTGTNSSTGANAKGVLGDAKGAGNAGRYGVWGQATGTGGIGVLGSGSRYGVFSNGPLGIAAGKSLVCTACVTGSDLANRIVVNYNLAAGAVSTPITIPANAPVQVMGANTTVGNRGVASATLLRAGAAPSFLEWTGLESTAGSAITQGFNATLGGHILFLDFAHTVDIEVNDANSIRIHNSNAAQEAGRVVITW